MWGGCYRTYHGAFNLRGVGNRIAHCWIHEVPHQGIGYSGNDHIIEYCDFEKIAQETGDVGAIYAAADWTFMGNEFRYNYFHNIHGPGSSAATRSIRTCRWEVSTSITTSSSTSTRDSTRTAGAAW